MKANTAVYPTGRVTTGEPIYPNLVNTVVMKFGYHFSSSLRHHITGTIVLRAILLSEANTWQQLSVIRPLTAFTGDSVSLTSSLPLAGLYGLISSLSAQSGLPNVNYLADIQPVVHITGTVGTMSINETFSPVLPFQVSLSAITLNSTVAAAPPGATYIAPTAASELAATLDPEQFGTIPHLISNSISVAKYQIQIRVLRLFGLILTGIALLVALYHDVIRRHSTRQTEEIRIARQFDALVVPVTALRLPEGSTEIDVTDFAHLAGLAQFLERPILYEMRNGTATYAVDDGARRYVFHPSDGSSDQPAVPEPSSATISAAHEHPRAPGTRQRRQSSALLRGGAGVVVVVAVVTLSASFTASTNVPASRAGTSTQPRTVAQLAPAVCSALNVTNLVRGTGTFSNSVSHSLVLGGAGTDTITDTGTDDCIVAGAGNNSTLGTASDICVSGPTLNIGGTCSNGVVLTPSSTTYNGYGAQEVLSMTNTSTVSALSIVITVARTTGTSFSGQGDSLPGGYMTDTSATTTPSVTYTFVLKAGKTIPAAYPGGTVYAEFGGTGTAHATSGDTWSATSTSNGFNSTVSGTF